MSSSNGAVEIVEVGPRDGLQGVAPFVPTLTKQRLIEAAMAAGLKRIEIGSFVSEKAVPQLRDTPDLLAHLQGNASIASQVLVPTRARGEKAAAAGAPWIAYVISVSERHNQANLRRSVDASVTDYNELAASVSKTSIRLNVATAFDCPFDGRIEIQHTLSFLERALQVRSDIEVCLCDTTGRANPRHVTGLFEQAMQQFPTVRSWAFHGHDTYGLGIANVLAAYNCGVRVFDAAFAGLGGCPFAPGATGNVATEDVAYLFDGMGVGTGLMLDRLVAIAQMAASLPGVVSGGRVRQALTAAACSSR